MGYHVVDPDTIPRTPERPSEMRYISEAVGMTEMGLRFYRVEPGEDIPLSGLHYHDQQEEAFYVVAGGLTVETPAADFDVPAGQFFIAEPASPHRAFNSPASEETAVVIGMGAPPVNDGHAVKS